MKTILPSLHALFALRKTARRCLPLSVAVWMTALLTLLLAGGQSARASTIVSTYTTAGGPFSWVCPAGCTSVQVECWGGGGAGGSCVSTTGAGGGGAGGAYVRVDTYTVSPSTTYYFEVGAAGMTNLAGNYPGAAGGNSWFSTSSSGSPTVALAVGGEGGGGGAAGVGGTNGTCPSGSIGNEIYLGGPGLSGVPTNTTTHATAYGGGGGGSGGNSSAGNTGASLGAAAAVTDGGPGGAATTTGNPGKAPTSGPGGGGGGGYSTASKIQLGGLGFAGQVVLTYTVLADFESAASGNWSSVSTWNVSVDGGNTWNPATSVPDNTANAIFITNGFTVTVDVPSLSANLNIASGSTLTMGTAGTLNGGFDAENIVLQGAFNYASSLGETNSGIISGAGTLTESGTGTLTLTGNSLLSGTTAISAGELMQLAGGSASSSALHLNGATGISSISITNNAMGWTNASFTASAAGVLDFNFGSVAPSTTVAPLQIAGAATFTATPTVTIEGNNITAGTYPLMTWGSSSGTAPSVVSLPGGAVGTLSVVGHTLDLVVTTGNVLVKANNANNLNLTSSWVTGVVPTGIAIWDDTVTSANSTVLGASESFTGLQILNPGGPVTIGPDGNTLTLAAKGIDMSAATANLNLGCIIALTGAQNWTVASGLTLTVSGSVTGTSGLDKEGPGTVVMETNAVSYSALQDVANGTLIYNDSTVTSSARIIPDATNNTYARLVITNGAVVTSSGATSNLRSGRAGSITGTNYMDLAGVYSLPSPDAGDGYAALYNKCGYSEMTFYPGGDFTGKGVISYGGGSATNSFRFDGGILRALQANATFITGITNVLVMSGGANIDDRGFAITIPEPLQDAGGGGGLAKIGVGTLTLSAVNTYTGMTAISNGVVALSGSGSVANSSAIRISSGATLDVSGTTGTYALNPGQTLIGNDTGAATATLNGSLNLGSGALAFNYASGTPALTVANGALTLSGNAVTVYVAGTALGYGSYLLAAAGSSGSVAGTLPSSVTVAGSGGPAVATSWLSLSGGQLYLNIDTITATNVSFSRNDLTAWKVAVTNLLANASDADSYTLSLAGVGLSTDGITPVISGGYVFYYNPSLVADQFTYTVTNNYGVTATGTITLAAGGASSLGGQIAGFSPVGGALSMSFDGIPGYKYNVQVSTNMSYPNGWNTIWTTNAPSGGVFQFQDNAPPTPAAYYRLMWNGN